MIERCIRCHCDLAMCDEVSSNPSVCQRCKPDFDIEQKHAEQQRQKTEAEVEHNLNSIRNHYLR